MAAIKTPFEMDRIRKADAVVQEKLRKAFVPEKNEHKPIAYFEIDRYTTGQFKGLFVVFQLIVEDEHGKPLRKPVQKRIVEGVDMVVAMSYMETALRRRVFR